MPLFEVVLAGTYFNQATINRWNYVGTGIPAAVSRAFALASAFGAIFDPTAIPPSYPDDTVLDALSSVTVNTWTWQQLTVINVYDPTDFYQVPFVNPFGGANAAEGMSPVVSFGFRTNQVRRDIARGTKRIPGVGEDRVGAGGVINGSTVTVLESVAEKMSEVITYDDEGNTITFAPCVVKKQEYDPNPDNPAARNHRAYRYYPTEAEQMENVAQGIIWQPYTTVRSQVSRQYQRGR